MCFGLIGGHQSQKRNIPQLPPTQPTEQPKLDIALLIDIRAASRAVYSGFWIAYKGYLGDTLSPSNLAAFIRVLNRADYPIKVTGYTASMASPLVKLLRVPFDRSKRPFFYGIPDKEGNLTTRPLLPRNGSDVSFAVNAETPIPARRSIEGWLLFEYPNDIGSVGRRVMTMKITDDYGETITYSSKASSVGAEIDSIEGAVLNLDPVGMIKGYHIDWYSKLYPLTGAR